jgi:hypothetical protein
MNRFRFGLVLVAVVGFGGCNKPESQTQSQPATVAGDDGHSQSMGRDDHSIKGHSHGAGPHGGIIADWGGGKFHVEFTVDHEKQQATAYILGRDEKTPISIDATSIELSIKDPQMLVTLEPSPQEGDTEGKSSRFVGTDEKLGVVKEYAGTLTGVVDGTPYSGDFAEESHDDHDQ